MIEDSRSSSVRVLGFVAKLGAEQDNEVLFSAPEVSVFVAALALVNQVRDLDRALKGREIGKGAFMERASAVLAQLAKTVAATERFDIVLPVADSDQFSPFFWRWFNWWEDYFKELTPTQVDEVAKPGQAGESTLEDHRPKGDWLSYRHTPAFTPVITQVHAGRSQVRL